MTNKKGIIIFFSLLVCLSYTQNCAGSTSDDLIQAGTIDIINPLAGARQTIAQTQIQYAIPAWGFQTALSFIDFQYNTASGLDFTLRGGRIAASNFLGISVLLLQDRRWQKIKVSFMVNSRQDIWIGSFTYSVYDLNSAQNSSGSLSASVQGSVDNWSADNSSLVLSKVAFISGVQTGAKDFSLALTNVTFDKIRGIIGVTLSNASRGIEQITITYVILVSPHSRFIYDSFAYPGTVPNSEYGMIGSSAFNQGVTGARYYGISIDSILLNCLGSCAASCITKSDCARGNGIVSGRNCTLCPANTKYNQTQMKCVGSCGVSQELVNGACQCVFGFIKLGAICVNRCGVNQQWNGAGCACSQGTARITGVCRQCPLNSVPNPSKDNCVCQGTVQFDQNTMRCVQTNQCPSNSTGVIQNGVYQCKCNTNFYSNGSTCVYCPSPALWNSSNANCYCSGQGQNFNGVTCISCPSGQLFNPSSRLCECISPRSLVGGECKCPNNLTYNATSNKCVCSGSLQILSPTNSSQCICIAPYIRLSTGECGLVCGQNQWWVGGQCVCKPPYVKINNKCTINCSTNQKWNGIQCVCIDNFFRINNTCVTCPINQIYSATLKSCINACGLNQIVNGTTCVCRDNFFKINSICSQCPQGTGFKPSANSCIQCTANQTSSNSLCVCKLGFLKINGVCGQCPSSTVYNKDKQSCDSSCKANETYNGSACVCNTGLNRVNGVCIQCAAGTQYNSITQLCESICKVNEIYTSSGCICTLGNYKINGACGQCSSGTVYNSVNQSCNSICKINEIYNGTVCICSTGFYKINGLCGQCSSGTVYNLATQLCENQCKINEVYSGSACICVQNYFRVNGVCSLCPASSVYNSVTQKCDNLCKSNEVYNGTACVCSTGFNRIGGVCGLCPSGTVYNSVSQACDSICREFQVYNGTACVCITGYYRINGFCGQCPSGTSYNTLTQKCNSICKPNQVYDGTACICQSGYYIINNACDKCQTGTYYDDSLKVCVNQPVCPARSQWNQAKLQCICSVTNQYLINKICQTCVANAGWNGSACVCKSGFYLIGSQCLTCDINSYYNSTSKSCICNRGFYGDRLLCQKCDASCGKCSGPNANQCIDCVDLAYTLQNGVCSKQSPCVAGKYFDTASSSCLACTAYCTNCVDQNTCSVCSTGFSLTKLQISADLTLSYCQEICGDGKRYEYACDDNNTVNGDGCNDQCQVQNGWTCSGGTTTSKSVCANFTPSRTIITPKGAVQLNGKVMQGITLSFLPKALTDGGCENCSQVLLISVIQGDVIPSYRVDYISSSQYKYLIEFDFHGIFGIPPFTFTVRINPAYAKLFTAADMAQLITVPVDVAVLAIGQEVQDLTIEQILGQKIPIADSDLTKVFG